MALYGVEVRSLTLGRRNEESAILRRRSEGRFSWG